MSSEMCLFQGMEGYEETQIMRMEVEQGTFS